MKVKANIFKKMKIKKEVKNITINDLHNDWWGDKDTYAVYIKMTDNLKQLLKYLIEDDDINEMFVEYWADENTFHYLLMFEYDNIVINSLVECDYLNDLVRDKMSITYDKTKGV